MDLLDDLEDRSDRTSFRIQYDPQPTLPDSSLREESQDILKKVQQKLAAINEDEQDIPAETNSTQVLELGDSLLFGPADTQILPQLDVEDAEISYTQPKPHSYLPQLDVEDADIDLYHSKTSELPLDLPLELDLPEKLSPTLP